MIPATSVLGNLPVRVARTRYATLDGMRGVAALCVVLRHFGDLRPGEHPGPNYIAVDLFFLLSGFVLSFAYAERLAKGMSAREFMIRRIVRLYPIYAIGALLALDWAGYDYTQHLLSTHGLALNAVASLLILPSLTAGYSPALFPRLVPAWSLFFELYVANAWFALDRGRSSEKRLREIVTWAGLVLMLAIVLSKSLDLGAIWPRVFGGFPRTLFSFFAGVLVQRVHARRPPRLAVPSWLVLSLFLLLVELPVPAAAVPVYVTCCVFVAFPALVYWGAEAKERVPRFGALLGDVSYAVYVLHYPVLLFLVEFMKQSRVYPGWRIEAFYVAGMVGLSYGVGRYYDEPVRRAITRWCVRRGYLNA